MALRPLADTPHGRTLAIIFAHGFPNAMLDKLVSNRLATIQPGTVYFGTQRITVAWIPELAAELVRRPVSLIARPEGQRQRMRRSPPRCDDSGLGRSA